MAEFGAGLLALLKLGLLLLAVTSIGLRLARTLDPDERPVAAFTIGMALLSTLTTLLLMARLPVPWILAAAAAGGLLWARRELAGAVRGAAGWVRARRSARGWEGIQTALVAVVGALGIVGCWAPATGWDTGVYHFALPRLRAETGEFVVRADIPFSSMPAGMESLYTVGFLFDGERLASLINFSFYFAGLALVRQWGRRAGGEGARTLAGFAYLTSLTYMFRLDGGDVEVGQAVALGLGLYALWRVREGGMPGGRLVAGTAFGFALAIKYSMAWAVLAAALGWAVLGWRDRRAPRDLLRDAGVIGLGAALVAFPCYLRNLWFEGNPIHPFLVPELKPVLAAGGAEIAGPRAWASALRMDAFLLAAVPAAVAAVRLRWLALVAAAVFASALLHTGLSEPGLANAVRFASPAFLPLWVLIGAALAGAARAWRWAGALGLAGAIALSVGTHAERNRRKVPVAVGLRTRDGFLDERVNSYWALRRAERELPADRRVLLVEPRSYYCRVPFVQAADIQRAVDFGAVSSPSEFRALLDLHSIGLIVYNHAPAAKTRSFGELLARVPAALEALEPAETRAGCTLYRVR